MKPRTTLVLAVLAIVVVAAGWYFGARTTSPTVEAEAAAGKPAFPNITLRLRDAALVEVTHQANKVGLKRNGDVWGVVQDSDYPAQAGKVHDLLAGLAELRLTEPRTADATEYGRLGVEDPGAKADSTLVKVSDAKGQPILSLIVGHSRTRGMSDLPDQVYVRRPGEARSWLAEGRLPLDDDALMWLDRQIINLDHATITKVVAERPGQPQIALVRKGDALAMQQPVEHPKLDPAKLDDVAHSLELLSFLRVQPAGTMPGKELGHSRFTTKDGMAVDVRLNQKGNEIWAAFTTTAEGKAKPEADKLEAKLKPWIYELGGWKEKVLVPAMADLALPEPKPAVAKTVVPAEPDKAAAPPMFTPAAGAPAVPPGASPAEHSAATSATPPAAARKSGASGASEPAATPASSAPAPSQAPAAK